MHSNPNSQLRSPNSLISNETKTQKKTDSTRRRRESREEEGEEEGREKREEEEEAEGREEKEEEDPRGRTVEEQHIANPIRSVSEGEKEEGGEEFRNPPPTVGSHLPSCASEPLDRKLTPFLFGTTP